MDTILSLDDDLDESVDFEAQIQRHIAETNQNEALIVDQLCLPVGKTDETGQEQFPSTESDEFERQHYLRRIVAIEKGMQEAEKDIQQRIDAMKRILELTDPVAQLSEYLTLKQEVRGDENVDIVKDLLYYANRMKNKDDSDLATVAAFFFWCEERRPKGRQLPTPIVAAVMKALEAFITAGDQVLL
ncbi:hypothetical protein PsorP6_009586 [Peronosclerospora sorghi]|uniref:Uncharacterized protein n=1 Tax=Peronosclerospora sorghi TaxID=230839 RepID=A0ACC0VYJ9_9STRA|nr:hypothetical protein PsorP6_009586 [Peronosclerospora sorghi]